MSNSLSSNAKVQLPFWMKMFSNDEAIILADEETGEVNHLVPGGQSRNSINEISEDSLLKIAKHLSENKQVILMNNGIPFKLFVGENGKVQITQLAKDSFEFK